MKQKLKCETLLSKRDDTFNGNSGRGRPLSSSSCGVTPDSLRDYSSSGVTPVRIRPGAFNSRNSSRGAFENCAQSFAIDIIIFPVMCAIHYYIKFKKTVLGGNI